MSLLDEIAGRPAYAVEIVPAKARDTQHVLMGREERDQLVAFVRAGWELAEWLSVERPWVAEKEKLKPLIGAVWAAGKPLVEEADGSPLD